MSVHLAICKVLSEYLKGKRDIEDCAVSGVKWYSLRRVLLASKAHHDAMPMQKSHFLAEKKRAEARFWLDNGIQWPHC